MKKTKRYNFLDKKPIDEIRYSMDDRKFYKIYGKYPNEKERTQFKRYKRYEPKKNEKY